MSKRKNKKIKEIEKASIPASPSLTYVDDTEKEVYFNVNLQVIESLTTAEVDARIKDGTSFIKINNDDLQPIKGD